MVKTFKYPTVAFCLLTSCLYFASPASAVSELTLHVTDLASVISTRSSVNAIDTQHKTDFLTALANMEQVLHHDEAKAYTDAVDNTHYAEMHRLLKITRTILNSEHIPLNQRDMLIQQSELLISKSNEHDATGADSIRSYYVFAKTINTEETFSLLSENARVKLPPELFDAWWNKTVDSVVVKKIQALGQDQYKVWLLYELQNGEKQCSEDWLQLIEGESGWLIDDFYQDQISVNSCENQ